MKEKPMSYQEANKINLKLWQKEPEEFAKMLLGFDGVILKRINIIGDRNYHGHDEIIHGKQYLVFYSGDWYLARATKYSDDRCDMYLGLFSVHLRSVDIVFEIDLPSVIAKPLGEARGFWDENCRACGCECNCEYDHLGLNA